MLDYPDTPHITKEDVYQYTVLLLFMTISQRPPTGTA